MTLEEFKLLKISKMIFIKSLNYCNIQIKLICVNRIKILFSMYCYLYTYNVTNITKDNFEFKMCRDK